VAVGAQLLLDGFLEHRWTLIVIGAALAGAASAILQISTLVGAQRLNGVGGRLQGMMSNRISELALALPGLRQHEDPDFQDRFHRVQENPGVFFSSVHLLSVGAGSLLTVVSMAVLLSRVDPLLLLLPLFAIPSLVATVRISAHEQQTYLRVAHLDRLRHELARLAASPAGGREARLFGLRDVLLSRFFELSTAIRGAVDRMLRIDALISVAGWLPFGVGYGIAAYLALERALHGQITPGQVLLTLILATQVQQMVWLLSTNVFMAATLLNGAARYLWLEDYARQAAPVVTDPADVPGRLTRGIRFEGVSFTYPGTGKPVLSDISLDLRPGSVVALVGENGAGKTTLVKLLCRFYDPAAGRITADGLDLRRFELEAWRARLSGGFQDFARLELLARESVGVGDLRRVEERDAVLAAAGRAGSTAVLEKLPQGLETQLGSSWEGGVDLSGGEWQRIALARAMMREHPLLLILDEPTAALDAETEHALFERYAAAAREGHSSGRVTVLVSHRFSTVRMADLIVVLQEGRIVESGSHRELMANHGVYAELFALQARSYR
jgi:ATP-binding cassette subfamily B protein